MCGIMALVFLNDLWYCFVLVFYALGRIANDIIIQ